MLRAEERDDAAGRNLHCVEQVGDRLLGTVTAGFGGLLGARQVLDVELIPSRVHAGSDVPASRNDGFCRLAGVVFLSLQLTVPHVGVDVLPAASQDQKGNDSANSPTGVAEYSQDWRQPKSLIHAGTFVRTFSQVPIS